MSDKSNEKFAKLALIIGIGGTIFAVLLGCLGPTINIDLKMIAYGIFVITQVVAIVIGIKTKMIFAGKLAAILHSALLILSLVTLS